MAWVLPSPSQKANTRLTKTRFPHGHRFIATLLSNKTNWRPFPLCSHTTQMPAVPEALALLQLPCHEGSASPIRALS